MRVSASIPADLASVQALVGIGAGGELITGNMMAVSTAWFAKRSLSEITRELGHNYIGKYGWRPICCLFLAII